MMLFWPPRSPSWRVAAAPARRRVQGNTPPGSGTRSQHRNVSKQGRRGRRTWLDRPDRRGRGQGDRSEEHTSELQSLMRLQYAVFCLKKQQDITLLTQHKDKIQ